VRRQPAPDSQRLPRQPLHRGGRLTTYGFEAEFGTGADEVARLLHAGDWTGDPYIHQYHCDCSYCEFGGDYTFRVQRDSTCSGEVISDVFMSDGADTGPHAMRALETAAIEADAEPGFTAGFHVHVGMNGTTRAHKARALWNFMRWERELLTLAAGRFDRVRDGMNRAAFNPRFFAHVRTDTPFYGSPSRVSLDWFAENLGTDTFADLQTEVLETHKASDRHSNLNIGTRHSTWEFRLWNSTRSAWRMEMFCRTSVALTSPAVVSAMLALPVPDAPALPGILDAEGHSRAAELVARQLHYSLTRPADLADFARL
jgi:hypothetical protein